jgi:hypothetical protein
MKSVISHTAVLMLLLACSGQISSIRGEAGIGPDLQGAWKEQRAPQDLRVLNIQRDRIVEFHRNGRNGDLIVRGFVRWDGDQLVLRQSGIEGRWKASLDRGRLRLEHEGKVSTFDPLGKVPEEVDLRPLKIGDTAKPLRPEHVQAIQAEISRRFEDEQALCRAIRQNSALKAQGTEVTQKNLIYLRELIREVGWIDATRFGAKTSVYTVILAKHTRDLRLMMTILPWAEKDLKQSGDGQTFAVLYDGLQLELGRKQLYGTQIGEDRDGPYVLPFEGSPESVNQRLLDMGLPPFDEYLSEISQALYSGKRVRVDRKDG